MRCGVLSRQSKGPRAPFRSPSLPFGTGALAGVALAPTFREACLSFPIRLKWGVGLFSTVIPSHQPDAATRPVCDSTANSLQAVARSLRTILSE